MSRSKWRSRPWVMLAALAFVFALSMVVRAAPPPATGQAIPPDDLPQNQSTTGGDAGGEEDLLAEDDEEIIDTSKRESEIYGSRIDGLSGDVDDLKERIFRSKARLSVLKETVLHGVLAGSRVIIVHRNLMGSQYRLTKLAMILDGAQIYARSDDSGALDQEDEVTVLDGNIVPGPHTITVELTYQGQGFGVFSYLNGYTFESRSSYNFTAPENGAVRLLSSGYEKGNLTTEMKDRPSVEWQEIALDASGKPLPQVKGKGKSKTSKSKSKSSKPDAKKTSDTQASDPAKTPASKPTGDPAKTPTSKPASDPAKTPASETPASDPAASETPASDPAKTPAKPQKPSPQKPGAAKPAASEQPKAGN